MSTAVPRLSAGLLIAYGPDTSQFGELRLPAGPGPHPVAVLLHGGCWRRERGSFRSLTALAEALAADGIATWNVEYRRLGEAGAGWPGTFLDVGRAVDHLRVLQAAHDLDLRQLVVVGHSAGGTLALWAGTRARITATSPLYAPGALAVRGVVSLAGITDLEARAAVQRTGPCRGTIEALLGGSPADVPARYAEVSAHRLLPLDVPQALVWGGDDEQIPLADAASYAAAAARAGDRVRLDTVPGVGHFDTARPVAPAWPVVRGAIRMLLGMK